MSKSFLKIVATKNEAVSKTFSDSQIRTGNTKSALRRKEFKHFTGSPTYMVNCGLGVLFLVAGAVFLLIKMQDVRVLTNSLLWTNPLLYQVLPVAGAFAICLLASFCDIAAPAISVEGKGIWVLQTLPVHRTGLPGLLFQENAVSPPLRLQNPQCRRQRAPARVKGPCSSS